MSRLNSDPSVIYTLDNLRVLRGLNSECIDLIYLDPPFNTGKQWHNPIGDGGAEATFNDIWGWEIERNETMQQSIERQWEEEQDYAGTAVREVVEAAFMAHSPRMGAYCAWIAPRLQEMQRILKPTGAIYLHCDPFAGSYLRLLMDAIFGQRQFRNEIEWKRTSSRSDAHRYGRIHDRLLYYTGGPDATWNGAYEPYDEAYIDKFYRHREDGRRYTLDNMASPNPRPNMTYTWRGFPPPNKGWRYERATMQRLHDEGRIWYPDTTDRRPRLKRYLDEQQGRSAGDVITDINPIAAHANERTGYPTQKPLALIERLITASTNPGDVVLDPFAGCATACIAAQKLERQWIGIDVEPKAVELCRQRLRDELGLFDETQELTSPPKREDERQLELIPGRRQLRLELWRQLQAAQQTDHPSCPECDRAPGIDFMEIDHIIPRAQGGPHTRDNVQLLCSHCNRSKGGRTMRQWRRAKAQAVKSL